MENDYVIIGGGVAGLSAALRLTELGAKPIIIESGDYPSHKVCGEFFSPECLSIIQRWDIKPTKINSAYINVDGHSNVNFRFKDPAGGLSHYVFDTLLMDRVKKAGATLLTNTKAVSFSNTNGKHNIELSNGDKVSARNLILAIGKLPTIMTENSFINYVGLKSHFKGIALNEQLKMYSFKGGYLGFSPIEDDKVNVACLVEAASFNHYGNPETFIEQLVSTNHELESIFNKGTNLFPKWMTVGIPGFGVKPNSPWPNTYCIGDAAATIPPITGMGLSMAIRGAVIAAEFAFRNDAKGFRQKWLKTFSTPIYFGKWLHKIALRPKIATPLLQAGNLFPAIHEKIYKLTR